MAYGDPLLLMLPFHNFNFMIIENPYSPKQQKKCILNHN